MPDWEIDDIPTTETDLDNLAYIEGIRPDGTPVKIPLALLTSLGGGSGAAGFGTMRPLTDLAQINISSTRSVTEVSGKAITVKESSPDGTTRIAGLTRALPASPARVAVFVQPQMTPRRYYGTAFGFSDGTKFHLFVLHHNSANLEQQTWSNSTTRVSATTLANTQQPSFNGIGFWLGMRHDASNVFFEFSADGVNFATIFTVSKASGYLGSSGYTSAFVGIFTQNTDAGGTDHPASITLRDWDEGGLSRAF